MTFTSSAVQVLEEAVSARFRSVSYLHTRGPGLAGHLSALQHALMADLATVRNLLEHCVPPHYRLTGAYLRASHHCLHTHLTQVSGGTDHKPIIRHITRLDLTTHVRDVCGLGEQLGSRER